MKTVREGAFMKHNEMTRLALLEQSIGHVGETLHRLDKRFDSVNTRFDKLDSKMEKLDDKIEETRRLAWSKFRWIMGAMGTLFITILAKGHGA